MNWRWVAVGIVSILLFGSVAVAETEPVTRGNFTYYFDHPQYLEAADSILQVTRTRLQTLLRSDLEFQAEVYLAGSETTFDGLIGGQFPDWGAAAAIPVRQRIVIKSPDSFRLNRPLGELLSHEYAHLALAYRTGLHSAPRWLDEGLAMVVSMEWSWSENLTLNLASVTGQFVPLPDIDQVNRFGESKARLSYAQSYLAVQYLFDTYKIEGVNVLLDQIARGVPLDIALIAATGSNYADFEEEIRVYLRQRFNLVGLVADTMYFWLALAIILIVGFILRMWKRRQYYRRWDEEEKMASTDFDYGDPRRPEESDDDEPWRR